MVLHKTLLGNRTVFLIPFFLLAVLFSCKDHKPKADPETPEPQREVELDSSFGKLLIRDRDGVTGADGVISFPLKNGKSVFMMGDSFVSEVTHGKRDPKSKMINNTFIEVDWEKGVSKSIYKGSLKDPGTMLVPIGGERTKEYYWPGHGFEHKGMLHVFMSKFVDDESIKEGWKFQFLGTDYLRLEPDTYRIISQENFPYTNNNGVHYGHSILKEADYTYIYGTWSGNNKTGLHVARATLDENQNKMENFEFFNGTEWVPDEKKSIKLKGIHKDVPEQFSVFTHNGKYILIMQERGLFKGNIYSYIADTPTGPWGNESLLYHTTEQANQDDEIITYNAMAHPQYIKDNKLLISYCINSLHAPNIHNINVDYYRPEFIWVPLEKILEYP